MKEEAKQQLLKEASIIAAPFLSEDGQKCLKSMKELFYNVRSYTQGDTHHTAFREGYKALIDFIDDNIRTTVRGLNDTGREGADRKPTIKRSVGESKETPV